eukprot:766847-Hanusia_phi.AAC.1
MKAKNGTCTGADGVEGITQGAGAKDRKERRGRRGGEREEREEEQLGKDRPERRQQQEADVIRHRGPLLGGVVRTWGRVIEAQRGYATEKSGTRMIGRVKSRRRQG